MPTENFLSVRVSMLLDLHTFLIIPLRVLPFAYKEESLMYAYDCDMSPETSSRLSKYILSLCAETRVITSESIYLCRFVHHS